MSDELLLDGLSADKIAAVKLAKNPVKAVSVRETTDAKREERLSAKQNAPKGHKQPTPAAAPALPVYSSEDRSKLLDVLQAYRERFPHLKDRNKISGKSTYEEIEDELHYIQVQLGGKRDGSAGKMVFCGVMSGMEVATKGYFNPAGLNLTGLGQVASDNYAEVGDIVDELMIKYGAGMYMSVEMRLAVAIGATVLTVHGANSGDPRVAAALEKMNRTVVLPESGKDL